MKKNIIITSIVFSIIVITLLSILFFKKKQKTAYPYTFKPVQSRNIGTSNINNNITPKIPIHPTPIKRNNLDYNYARISGDSLHLYSAPINSDSTLIKICHKEDLNVKYIKIVLQQPGWYKTEDSLWIHENEVTPYYSKDSPYDQMEYGPTTFFEWISKNALTIKDTLLVYNISDTLLIEEPQIIVSPKFIYVIDRRDEGISYGYSLLEVLKVTAILKNNTKITGWAKAEELVLANDTLITKHTVASGFVGLSYDEPGGCWTAMPFSWFKISDGFISLGFCAEYWLSPNGKYIMSVGWQPNSTKHTAIYDTSGFAVFTSTASYTSPTWYKSFVFVRGMYDDDAVYKIDLGSNTITPFFKLEPGGYPNYGSGDGYSAWPISKIDTLKKQLTIPFIRNKYYDVTVSLKGDIIKIDSTANYEY